MLKMTETPLWTAASAVYPYSPGLEAAYKFVSTYGEEVCMAAHVDNHLHIPRGCAPVGNIDARISNPVPAISCKCPALDAEQANVIACSIALLQSGQDHVIEAPTGFGKTYIGSAVAVGMSQTTIIMVTKQDLMKQWKDTLVNLIGVPESDIGIAQASKLEYVGKRFVLAMVQSVIRPGKYDKSFYEYFGLVVFDETHRMAAECFSRACQMFPGKYRIGLSATPKRTDGKTPVITAHIGPVLVKGHTVPMKPKVLVEATGWSIPAWMKDVDPGKMMGVYGIMSKDFKRNTRIVQFACAAYQKGRSPILMSDRIDHLSLLSKMLINVGIPAGDVGVYTGETHKMLLKENALRRIVLATYGMCSEGTDYPQWDTLVMCTPRANVKQPLGRILRKKPEKKQPINLDLVDNASIFKAFYQKRLKQYFEVGAEVKNL